MKKMLKFSALVLILGLAMGLFGCPSEDKEDDGEDEYAKYYEGSYRDNVNGSVEVVNNTKYDMLLFSSSDSTITVNNIVGGVRAFSTNTVNFSKEADYTVGGYKVIHAVKESVFKTDGEHSRTDHSAMVTYRDGAKYRTNIVSTTDGAYEIWVQNMNAKYALELRKNSPEGEKIAYLTRNERYRQIKSPTNATMTLFPVWIAFNNVTKTIVSFTPSDVGDTWEGQRTVAPRAENDPQGRPEYNFPEGQLEVEFPDINFPFATIWVRNNVIGRVIDFRNGGSPITAKSDYPSIPSGFRDYYEIRAVGEPLNLNIGLENWRIPVRFADAPGANSVTIQNGHEYFVAVNLKTGADPSQAASYEAILVDNGEMDKKDLLVSGQ